MQDFIGRDRDLFSRITQWTRVRMNNELLIPGVNYPKLGYSSDPNISRIVEIDEVYRT